MYYIINNSTVYFPLKKLLVKFKNTPNLDNDITTFLLSEELSQLIDYTDELKKKPDNNSKYSDLHSYSIGIIPTNRCGLRCTYCYSETGKYKKIDLTYRQIDQIINMLIRNAVMHTLVKNKNVNCKITFCGGGEPTYNWNLFSYCVNELKRKGKENNIKTSVLLITNGMLSSKQIEFIVENVDQINISMDGPDFIQNNQRPTLNGGESFAIVDNAIRDLAKRGKNILIRSTVVPENFDKLEVISNFFFTNYSNIDMLHLEPLFDVGRGKEIKTSSNDLKTFMYNYVRLYEYVKKNYPNKRIFNSSFSYQFQEYGCGASIGLNPWVHMDGKILPCTEYIKGEEFIVGTVNENDIKFNNSFQSLANETERCKECFAFYHCAGGCCRNILQDANGNMLTDYAEQFCQTTKDFWYMVFDNLLQGISTCGIQAKDIHLEKLGYIEKACLLFA